jgi:FAD/FMN-containing dehydrogenase
MSRFNDIQYHPSSQTLEVGAGCLFDEIYKAIERFGVGIVGGSGTQAVGIGGWLLGGGYSLKTNQYGLGIDNIERVEVVLPSGEVVIADDTSHPDLFVAIKVCLIILQIFGY